jgi:hypothetical protein
MQVVRASLLLAAAIPVPAHAASSLSPGDLFLATHTAAVHRLDGASGEWSTVSGATIEIGGIALDPLGGILFGDVDAHRLLHYDTDSGLTTEISSAERGEGSGIVSPEDLATDASGAITLVDRELGPLCNSRLLRIDRETGDRTPLDSDGFLGIERIDWQPVLAAELAAIRPNCDSVHGNLFCDNDVQLVDGELATTSTLVSGPITSPLTDVAVAPDGAIFVTNQGLVSRVDEVGKTRDLITGPGLGSGASLSAERVIALSDVALLVVDDASSSVAEPTLVRVDIATGDRTPISGAGIGAGPAFFAVTDLAFESSASALVVNGDYTVLRVDLATGDRTTVIDPIVGSGSSPPEGWSSLAVRRGHPMLGAASPVRPGDYPEARVYRIDPETGDRTLLSGGGAGSGPLLGRLELARDLEPNGNAIGLAWSGGVRPTGVLVRVDAATGARSVVSSADVGSGPVWQYAGAVALATGSAFVSSQSWIYRVDLATGDRTLLLDAPLSALSKDALAAAPNGDVFTSTYDTITRVDAKTGTETLISGPTRGTGPSVDLAFDMAVAIDGSLRVLRDGCYTGRFVASELIRVDPETGDRVSLAMRSASALAVVPEPSPTALAIAAALAIYARRAAQRVAHR